MDMQVYDYTQLHSFLSFLLCQGHRLFLSYFFYTPVIKFCVWYYSWESQNSIKKKKKKDRARIILGYKKKSSCMHCCVAYCDFCHEFQSIVYVTIVTGFEWSLKLRFMIKSDLPKPKTSQE